MGARSSIARATAVVLAAVACGSANAAPAGAAPSPASGTVDLATIGPFDEQFRTEVAGAGGKPGARAYVGDVNGGLGDIAIGVPTADPGGRTDAGSVYVLYGGGEGSGRGSFQSIDLASLGTRGYRIDGAARGDRLGASIVPLGYDIGGDGLADLAVAAPRASDGGPEHAGVVYLVPGTSGRRPDIDLASNAGERIVRITGAAADDGAGEALSAPPRSRRLIVGASRADPGGLADAGSAFVLTALPANVPESATLSLASEPGFRLDGRFAGGRAGFAVGWALDFDGNDRSEVLVGAPGVAPDASETFAGAGYIVPFGRTGATTLGASPAGGIEVLGEPGAGLGTSVTGLADISHDGLGDVAFGAPSASPGGRAKAGSVRIVASRRPTALTPAVAAPLRPLEIDGAAAFDRLGSVVAAADLHADRAGGDLLVSAPGADALGRLNAGAIYALRGSQLAGVELARLGADGVRLVGPRALDRSGTVLSVNGEDLSLAIVGGDASTSVLQVPAPAPAPAPPAPAAASGLPGCTAKRDIELVVDATRSMSAAVPFLRTAVEATLARPRSAQMTLGVIAIESSPQQLFAPLMVPAAGFSDARELATLRLLLDEHLSGGAGTADYGAAIDAAVAARPEAAAIVLVTDAAAPPAPGPLRAPGKPVYVLQIGSASAPARASLRDLARRSGGRYYPRRDSETLPVETLPAALALAEAGLTCEHFLSTDVISRTASGKLVEREGAGPALTAETTLSPRRPRATFTSELLSVTRTATLTISYRRNARASSSRRPGCVRTSTVSLRALRIVVDGREVARLGANGVRRALSGRATPFGGVLRALGRCGRGFLVVEIAGLERLAGAGARAAASSLARQVIAPVVLRGKGGRHKVVAGGTGSSKRKHRR